MNNSHDIFNKADNIKIHAERSKFYLLRLYYYRECEIHLTHDLEQIMCEEVECYLNCLIKNMSEDLLTINIIFITLITNF